MEPNVSKFWLGVFTALSVVVIAGVAYALGLRVGEPSSLFGSTKETDHRALVRSQMIDPASAIFDSDVQSVRDSTVWCGMVNGRNRLGGMTGPKRYIAFMSDGEVNIDGETSALPLTGSGAEVFAGRLRTFCSSRR